MSAAIEGSESACRSGLRIQFMPATAWPEVAPAWSELVRCSAQRSIFVSEEWVETWLQIFGPHLDVSIVTFTATKQLVGVCLLVKPAVRWSRIPLRRTYLNAAGEPDAATTYVEFNTMVCRPGWECAVAEELAGYLRGETWDEFVLNGFTPGACYEALKTALGNYEHDEVWHPSYYVDLRQLRSSASTLEGALGRTTRKHLRQNMRSYAEFGRLHLDAAEDCTDALAMFDELAELNRQRWSASGRNVVFASPLFTAFHRTLIQKCMQTGGVQLLRQMTGPHIAGYIYNLVYGKTVYFYQCGFHYSTDKRLSPGTLALTQAIERCLDLGYDSYEFLSGNASYKQRLSTGSRQLVWATFRRPGIRTCLLELARGARQWLHRRPFGDTRNT